MPKNRTTNCEYLQSQVISFLRFPLCVLVVMIHVGINTKDCPEHSLYDSVHYLFADIIARVAVPLFFLFSGFLFFYRTEKFTWGVYNEKLAKRVRTLLIPYVFWNLLIILCLCYLYNYGENYSLTDWLRAFWCETVPVFNGEGIASYPVSNQFWYIRDLMVTAMFSPLIYLICKRTYYYVLILGVLWVLNCWFLVTGINLTALFFFSLGAYFSIHKKNFVDVLKPYTVLLGFAYLFFSLPVFFEETPMWTPLRRIGILLGMAFTISLVARSIESSKCKVNTFLSESSFFIFAYHILALTIGGGIVSFSLNTDVLCTCLYFFEIIAVIVIGLMIFGILRKWFPRFLSLITGGR